MKAFVIAIGTFFFGTYALLKLASVALSLFAQVDLRMGVVVGFICLYAILIISTTTMCYHIYHVDKCIRRDDHSRHGNCTFYL